MKDEEDCCVGRPAGMLRDVACSVHACVPVYVFTCVHNFSMRILKILRDEIGDVGGGVLS